MIVEPWEMQKKQYVNVDLTRGWATTKRFLAPLEQANSRGSINLIISCNFPVFSGDSSIFVGSQFPGKSLTSKEAVHWL